MARIEARLDPNGSVIQRRSAGSWEPVELRTDWARVDATSEMEIERQAAFDDTEAPTDATAWVRRVRQYFSELDSHHRRPSLFNKLIHS